MEFQFKVLCYEHRQVQDTQKFLLRMCFRFLFDAHILWELQWYKECSNSVCNNSLRYLACIVRKQRFFFFFLEFHCTFKWALKMPYNAVLFSSHFYFCVFMLCWNIFLPSFSRITSHIQYSPKILAYKQYFPN